METPRELSSIHTVHAIFASRARSHARRAPWRARCTSIAGSAPGGSPVSGIPNKRPSVIVMRRLDTHGLRVLSQSAGPGTRRAGVRLSISGELTPHRRGEPISDAPSPAAAPWVGPPEDSLAIETPALIDASGKIAEELRSFALKQLELQKQSARASRSSDARGLAKSEAPSASSAPLPALTLEPAPRRSTRTAWSAGVLMAGGLSPLTAPPGASGG